MPYDSLVKAFTNLDVLPEPTSDIITEATTKTAEPQLEATNEAEEEVGDYGGSEDYASWRSLTFPQ